MIMKVFMGVVALGCLGGIVHFCHGVVDFFKNGMRTEYPNGK